MNEYENVHRIIYKDEVCGDACFVRVCEKCGRFVKADEIILVNEISGLSPDPNATCSKCGRTHMLFEGFL